MFNRFFFSTEPPKENGGSNVTSYEATCIASSRSGQEEACEVYKGVDPECTVGSLKPNTQYEICARAINAVGVSWNVHDYFC